LAADFSLLAEHLHKLLARLLVFHRVGRRTVEGLVESAQGNGKAHRLLLEVHGRNDHLLALAHGVHHFGREIRLRLTARGEADHVLQIDRLVLVDLRLDAGRDHERIGGGQPDDELLLFLTFNLAHHGGDQDHAGIGIEPFVIDEADFLVLGLLVLHAELDPGVLRGGLSLSAGRRLSGRSSSRRGRRGR
jgi:hypothetical protein